MSVLELFTAEFWIGVGIALAFMALLGWGGWRYLKSLEEPLEPDDDVIVRDISERARQHQRQREARRT